MILMLLIVFGVIISTTDIRTHRIPNRVLFCFLLCATAISYPDLGRFARLSAISLLLGLLLSIIMHIGMGDVKLIAVLIPMIGKDHSLNVTLLMICICVTSLMTSAITVLKKGTISVTIPWAPSLFAASILYLATQ
jgi:Flp pilus assembly protein protease CpaA